MSMIPFLLNPYIANVLVVLKAFEWASLVHFLRTIEMRGCAIRKEYCHRYCLSVLSINGDAIGRISITYGVKEGLSVRPLVRWSNLCLPISPRYWTHRWYIITGGTTSIVVLHHYFHCYSFFPSKATMLELIAGVKLQRMCDRSPLSIDLACNHLIGRDV